MSYRLLVVFLLLLPLVSTSQQDDSAQIDAIFSDWDCETCPGASVLVLKDGEVLHEQGYGMADLEHNVHVTPSTVFYAGSVSKQFVACCIAILAERGELSLDDPVHRYFAALPDYGHEITIRHLIHHTSGITDYFSLLQGAGRNYFDHPSLAEVLALIYDKKTLDFAPGEKYQYSNSGYLLLAQIIQKVSGQTLAQFAAEEIFQVLGMADSRFLDDINQLVPNRAWGYLIWDTTTVKNMLMRFDLVGSGGLYTTTRDLAKWDANFSNNQLNRQSASLVETMQTPGIMSDGTPQDYAFAMRYGEHLGMKTVGHTGSLGGYRAAYFRYPAQGLSIIILSNAANYVPADKVRAVAEVIFKSGN